MTEAQPLVLLVWLALGLALPKVGPPPDPSAGETYDGRAAPEEPSRRRIALLGPRLVLAAPRLALRLVRWPTSWVAGTLTEDPLRHKPPSRTGLSPVGSLNPERPALGLRMWARNPWGPGTGRWAAALISGGPRFVEARVDLDPSPLVPVGFLLHTLAAVRRREVFYDRATRIGAADVVAVDLTAGVALRPFGGAGRYRLILDAGAALRSFSQPTTAELAGKPTFAKLGLRAERLGRFDLSRDQSGGDASLSMSQAIGIGHDPTRTLTLIAETRYGISLGRGRAVIIRATCGDQLGSASPYDRLSLGGNLRHRGFASFRFRGAAIAHLALDYRHPLLMTVDGLLFLEHGATLLQHFQDADLGDFRTSLGAGLRLFRVDRFLLRGLVAWGLGDGLRFSITFDRGL